MRLASQDRRQMEVLKFELGDTVRIKSKWVPGGEIVLLSKPQHVHYANAPHMGGVVIELVSKSDSEVVGAVVKKDW